MGQLEEQIKVVANSEIPTAVALRPGEDAVVMGYYADATSLLTFAKLRAIQTAEDVKGATDDLSIISKVKKLMDAKRKGYLAPLKEQSDAVRATYEYLMAPILEADKITRDKMLVYGQEQQQIRLKQEEVNRLRMEAAKKEMELSGELSESVNLVEVTQEPAKVTRTDMGTAGMVDCWKYEVADFALLPDEYKVADNAILNAVAKRHHDQKLVPGVRFYNEPIISVRAR